MQSTQPPVVLIFGAFDPSGSSSLPADAVTCASLGCHPLGTLTAIQVRDSANLESILPVGPETIDDQARCVLEDMNVQAIKVGALYTAEAVSVLAQIAADYNHVPLLLQLAPYPDESALEDIDTEDVQMAMLELLLPQTDVVVIDHLLLEQWQSQGLFAGSDAQTPAQAILEFGAGWLLTTGASLRPGQRGYMLQGSRGETMSWPLQPPPERLADADGPLACAITAELANGKPVPQAVEAAIAVAAPLAARYFQPGMGLRLINRSTAP